ncbi:MAG TPA: isopentenyl-diphosphate Delta-isomerase [Trebonia sp.]|nr:isopentenyl-diphosphate Delta-isomerase [Trebonia sp.]
MELVDGAGRPAGVCSVAEAHTAPGRRHRAFSVMLFDGAGRVLLQQRAAGKTRFPNRWSNTCCGHQAPGQDTAAAAVARLADELGITAGQLTALAEVGAFHYHATDPGTGRVEDEWDHVLVATLAAGAPAPAAAEVRDCRWADPAALRADLRATPDGYTPWLPRVLDIAVERRPPTAGGRRKEHHA